ncbi:MAG: hypothetical protein ACRDV4_09935 [Acidimicrobiales bacterium]
MLYDDGLIACDDSDLVIRRYYPWLGPKKIPYASIRSFSKLDMTGLTGRLRIWGSGDFRHWWNLDTKRPSKSTAFVLDLGGRVLPTISPDDPQAVERILTERTRTESTGRDPQP